MSGKDDLSIYVHIPFCTKKCPYCHFYVVLDKEPLKDLLLKALLQELTLRAPLIQNKKLISLYFGGGTPSLFHPRRIEAFIEKLSNLISLKDIEITLEANPENGSLDDFKAYKDVGINRLSFGVQSFHDDELHILGRTHSSFDAKQAIENAYEAGIHNISLDLMYETPKQSLISFQKSLDEAVKLPISHLSLYNLTFEENTPFFKKESQLKKLIVDEEIRTEMYQNAIDILTSSGFKQYEISAFCKNGAYSRHNVGYWTCRPFLGFGPSAFSFMDNVRFQNTPNLTRYAKLLETGELPIEFQDEVSPQNRKKELLAVALRLKDGVFLDSFGELDEDTMKSLDTLISQGLLTRSHNRVALSEKGLFFYDTVASEII